VNFLKSLRQAKRKIWHWSEGGVFRDLLDDTVLEWQDSNGQRCYLFQVEKSIYGAIRPDRNTKGRLYRILFEADRIHTISDYDVSLRWDSIDFKESPDYIVNVVHQYIPLFKSIISVWKEHLELERLRFRLTIEPCPDQEFIARYDKKLNDLDYIRVELYTQLDSIYTSIEKMRCFAEGKSLKQDVKLSDIEILKKQLENAKELTSGVNALSIDPGEL
jgi:hypothetical protein